MKKSHKVAVNQLQVGNFIRLSTSWKDHPFLFSSFRIKEQAQIELMKKVGIKEVFVDLKRSDLPPLSPEVAASKPIEPESPNIDSLSESLKQQKKEQIEVMQRMRRELKKTEKEFERSIAQMRNLINKLRSRPLNAVEDAHELVKGITDQLLDKNDLVLHLMGEASGEDNIYYHSLNVAVLSLIMAKELGWEREELELVGMGALFHDTGMLKIPSQLSRKKTALTPPEQNFINQHPLMGVKLLKLANNFPEKAFSIVEKHHEYLDGSGTPKGLKEDAIDKFAQLVTVINLYDSLCHPVGPTKAKTPYAALSFIYKNYTNKLNQEITGKMIKMLGVYPPGSVVELSSGQFAIVMAVNLKKILLPRIMVYDPLIPKEQAPIVDLETEGIAIVRSIAPNLLPDKIFKYLNPRERISYYFGDSSN